VITLILLIAITGFIVWLVINYVPMPQPFKMAIIVITVILLLIYVMRILGVQDIPVR
jgi:hypothetical protein